MLSWHPHAWEDYVEWQRVDRNIAKRINELIKECLRTPFEGKGNRNCYAQTIQVTGLGGSPTNIGWSIRLRMGALSSLKVNTIIEDYATKARRNTNISFVFLRAFVA